MEDDREALRRKLLDQEEATRSLLSELMAGDVEVRFQNLKKFDRFSEGQVTTTKDS